MVVACLDVGRDSAPCREQAGRYDAWHVGAVELVRGPRPSPDGRLRSLDALSRGSAVVVAGLGRPDVAKPDAQDDAGVGPPQLPAGQGQACSAALDARCGGGVGLDRRLCGGEGWRYAVRSGADSVLLHNRRFLTAYQRPWHLDEDAPHGPKSRRLDRGDGRRTGCDVRDRFPGSASGGSDSAVRRRRLTNQPCATRRRLTAHVTRSR